MRVSEWDCGSEEVAVWLEEAWQFSENKKEKRKFGKWDPLFLIKGIIIM